MTTTMAAAWAVKTAAAQQLITATALAQWITGWLSEVATDWRSGSGLAGTADWDQRALEEYRQRPTIEGEEEVLAGPLKWKQQMVLARPPTGN